jgi:hypothetical protein
MTAAAPKTAERKITPGCAACAPAPPPRRSAAVLADQENGRAEALAKIEVDVAMDLVAGFAIGRASTAPHTPTDAPAPVIAPGTPRRTREARQRPALRNLILLGQSIRSRSVPGRLRPGFRREAQRV